MLLELGVTAVLYVLIALGVFALRPWTQRCQRRDGACRGGKPVLGQAGFAIMVVAALLATSSSMNANIYSAAGSTARLAETGTFPPVFRETARVGGTRGLVISVILVLLLAALMDLTAIASLGQRRRSGHLPGLRPGGL